MKKLLCFALFLALLIPARSTPQEKTKGNIFMVPGAHQQTQPASLTIDAILEEPSGNGKLDPGETAQLIVAVVNVGGMTAKDVGLKLSTPTSFDGITFGKVFKLGTINPSAQRTIVITVSLIGSKTLPGQKGSINIEVTGPSIAIGARTKIAFETTSSTESAKNSIAGSSIRKPALSRQTAPSEKLSPAIRQLQERLAKDPDDYNSRLSLMRQLFLGELYGDVISESMKPFPAASEILGQRMYLVGESYRQLQDYGNALEYLQKAYTLIKAPDRDLSTSYALALLHFSKAHDALAVVQQAARSDSAFTTRRIAEGDKRYRQNDFEDAADEFMSVFLVDKSRLSNNQLTFTRAVVDFRNLAQSADSSAATTSFVQNAKEKVGETLDFDELAAVFASMNRSQKYDDARDLYFEILDLGNKKLAQDTLDKKFLAVAYSLLDENPEIGNQIRIVFIREMKVLYGLDDEEVRPVYSLHDFVLKQGLVNSAAEISTSLVNTSLDPRQRFVQLSDVQLKFKKNDDAVGTFGVMMKKKGLDRFAYAGDLARMYRDLLQSHNTAEAREFIARIEALNESDFTATYSALADILTKAGKIDESIKVLQTLVQNEPSNVALGDKLGEAFLAKGRFDDVIASFTNVKTKQGRRYLALAYEKKYFLAEANRAWEEFRKLTDDPKESADAKKHIDVNLIAMMSPDFSRLKEEANRPKRALAAAESLHIVIDSPINGIQTSTNSIEVTGRVVGAVTLKDMTINGVSVGTPRGMKAVESSTQTNTIEDTSKAGLPFAYAVTLKPGKNEIRLVAIAPEGDSVGATVSIVFNAEAKSMTIEEADGIRQTKAYAVIIGIDKYKDAGIRGLNYTVNDAQELANVLTDPTYGGFKKENVTVLLNEAATTKNIKMAIGVDLKRAPEDGIAVVFFAGHGAPEGEKTYWLTFDADPNSLYASSLSNDEIADMLARINTRRVVTFLDCCYSGASITSTRSTRAVVIEDPFKSLEGAGSITITSSNGREQSLEDPKLKHGVFTYRLLEAIKGKADFNADGIVMADEIARYVKETVPNDARERSHKQDPVVAANYTGYLPISKNSENVLKSSRISQIQHFQNLYRSQKIDGLTLKKVREIIEGDDEKAKQPIRDYFNHVFDLKDLLNVLGK